MEEKITKVESMIIDLLRSQQFTYEEFDMLVQSLKRQVMKTAKI